MTRPLVAVIPGDDAAPEAMAAAMTVLRHLDPPVDWDELPPGVELTHIDPVAREAMVRARIDASDTVLFGSTNGTTPGVEYMRWGRHTFANVRPVRWRPGYQSPLTHPEGIDYVIVRENLEDAYVGIMGDVAALHDAGLVGPRARLVNDGEGRYAVKVITRAGTEQVARFAFELAVRRRGSARAGKVTVSAKTNMLPMTDRWFCEIAREVGRDYPDIEFEQYIVDDMAHRLVLRPHEFDVVLLPNLYGDVLSDEGAATIGGLGLAPSGCYGDDFAYFESAHGTAPDIAGRDLINPTATLLSAVMLLDHLGLADAAQHLDDAVATVYAEGKVLPVDQGGTAGTTAFAAAVADAIA
ncbi:MAG: 3-isopropylmalate dehydrogenase [Acidimicrobiaceae bacterium]|jgi:isocitrate/isopropylmalate dehydrogenase|nr:3-isopropylmalate dehydrogenase [Acidimicrobiaceae bacterium]